MIPDRLASACASLDSCERDLQRAYTEAVDAENEFASIVLLDLCGRAVKLRKRLEQARSAAENDQWNRTNRA